jgi:YesN/AraC family two-component response regulator
MPKKNGREMLEEIRRMKPGTKFVFISGYTADIIHGKGILEDDVDFLPKPFVKTDLLRKVREVLDRGEGCGHVSGTHRDLRYLKISAKFFASLPIRL